MPTRPVKKKTDSGDTEQPPSDPDMGTPQRDDLDNTGDSAYDFGESKPIIVFAVHHRDREFIVIPFIFIYDLIMFQCSF